MTPQQLSQTLNNHDESNQDFNEWMQVYPSPDFDDRMSLEHYMFHYLIKENLKQYD